MDRQALLDHLSHEITAGEAPHPTRVGIDGMDAAGKTTLAGDLAAKFATEGRTAVRASVDNFRPLGHKNRSASGAYTPQSYYTQGFKYDAFRRLVLEPAGPDGDRRCRLRLNDTYNDTPYEEEWIELTEDTIVVVDGVFLNRPELASYWDFYIWLDIDMETSLRRSIERDGTRKPEEMVIDHHANRNMPAFQLYQERTNARGRADMVIDNNDPANPELLSR